ncbi:MAG: hypothetical protein RJA63_1683 [Pseudomonadota bacterium]|jgi:uncharacterized protein (TIGR00266 family)
MPIFTITGDIDPFLHVSLRRGETIYCESNAMVMMEAPLDLTGSVQGGIFQAAMRRLANGESFFQQKIQATRGDGDCLLSPTMPGGLQVLNVGTHQYNLSDGVYVAATSDVKVTARMQSVGNALFGGTGGFFIGQSSGSGQLVVNGFGSLFMLNIQPDKEVIIDNGHVVAWDANLQYTLAASTNQRGGMLSNLVGSATTGEGVVLRFSGAGQVLVCSRNRDGFVAWLASKIGRNGG